MQIEVLYDKPEPEALGRAVIHALRWKNCQSPTLRAVIHCNERLASGWLEYIIVLRRPADEIDRDSIYLSMGMIQREPGAEYEFHS